MPQSYCNLLYHVVFGTKGHKRVLLGETRGRLYEYMGGAIRGEGGICLRANGPGDHLHIAMKLPPDKPLADIVRALKANSSGWIHRTFQELEDFHWQNGYAAFSVSASQLAKLFFYIENQEEHHKRVSFREEVAALLKASGVEYDEKFFWKDESSVPRK